MKTTIQAAAAAITLIASSAADAQDAVQWKVSDGGNGHWYQGKVFGPTMTSAGARGWSHSHGGHLVTITSAGEQLIVQSIAASDPNLWSNYFLGPLIGMQRSTGACWLGCWDTGESVTFTKWHPGNPDPSLEGCVFIYQQGVFNWQDYACDTPGWGSMPVGAIVEWSADCNNDGIVDYGQCRNGSLPDHDGDNVPDCCEAGSPCVTGNYPVQWRVEDGGNGHWYEIFNRAGEGKIDWLASRATAVERGGDLATFTSEAETIAFLSMTSGQTQGNPWIGLFEDPAGDWRWVTGEPLAWTNWAPTEPSGDGDWANMWIDYGPAGMWNDYRPTNPQGPDGFVVEWSADCNNDGIVDYGQILRGDFADVNRNGTPDTCECLGDVLLDGNINGADLGAVLFYWGPAPAGSAARACDFNADGQVDGADLGILLAAWGPCPG